jgi:LuxR family maltose regulon positive regulatory protein
MIMLGSIATIRAYLANLRGESHTAADSAQKALEYLPDSNDFACSLRSVATSILGDASWMNGDLENAGRAYLEAVRISQAAGSVYMTMIGNTNLAEVLMEQGELHQAARILSETLQNATRPDGQKLPLADRIYAQLGEIFFEWNQLDAATQSVHQSIETSRQWGNSTMLAKGYVRSAWLERAGCNPEKAEAAIRAAEELVSEGRLSPRHSLGLKFSIAHWWLVQGSPERALNLVQQSGVSNDSLSRSSEISYLQVPAYILVTRLLLAQDDYDAAISLTGRLLEIASAVNRMGWVIEILVLQALAWQGRKDLAQAMEVLEKAILLAQPEGYIRTFLDEGEPMAKLLYHAKSYRMGGGYASELLSALGAVTRTELPSAQLLIEPLTSRELEVLKLIEAGCSNLDIADRLVISIPTVKRHISNIYTKLGAKSRTQAISLGRELRLFD